jgi:hypothetical protein
MSRCVLPALLAVIVIPVAAADQAAAGNKPDICLSLNNRILGPRAAERPLPLLSGDPTQGFHAACTVPWSKLSPSNQPLPVTDCYRGSLLQVENAAACGRSTGPLWINSRWVVTSAELSDTHSHAVFCQQLETGAWAGTRDLKIDCIPQKKELSVDSVPPATAPATPTGGPAAVTAPAAPSAPPAPAAPATPPHSSP